MLQRLAIFILVLSSFLILQSHAQSEEKPEVFAGKMMGDQGPVVKLQKDFACAQDPEKQNRETEARAGCIECLAAENQTKEADKISQTAKLALDLTEEVTKESEQERIIREIRTYKLMLPTQSCPTKGQAEAYLKPYEEQSKRYDAFLKFLEKHHPDYNELFDSEEGLKFDGSGMSINSMLLNVIDFSNPADRYRLEQHFNKSPDNLFKDTPIGLRAEIQKSLKDQHNKIKNAVLYMQSQLRVPDYANDVSKCHERNQVLNEVRDISGLKMMSVNELKMKTQKLDSYLREMYAQQLARPGSNACGMSILEFASLMWYTGSGYGPINGVFRDPKEKPRDGTLESEDADAFVIVAKGALSKLRNHEKEVLRGISLTEAQIKTYQVGEIVTDKAFVSTSATKPFARDVVFIIRSKTGKFLGPYSSNTGENEVLFAPNTKFKVLETQIMPKGKRSFITMEEVN